MKFNTLVGIFLVFAIRWNVSYSLQQPNSPALLPAMASNNCSLQQDNMNILRRSAQNILNEIYTRPCSCGGAGWTRVAYFDMSDPTQTCPSNWTLNTSPVRGRERTSSSSLTCDSVFYPVNGLSYSRVCGMASAYHKGEANGFGAVNVINDPVSGLSVTHGQAGSRQHVWTFVVAENDVQPTSNDNCPRSNPSITWPYSVPSFLGNDYFCDTGRHQTSHSSSAFYNNDPLWDGEGCASTSSCCEFNSPPWFCKSLPQPTTDDLEIRLCNYFTSGDKIVTLINIYVQ